MGSICKKNRKNIKRKRKKMNIVIYHPNIHLYGGGETVCLTIASELSKKHKVTIYTIKKPNKQKLEKFFDLNLKKVNFKLFGQEITKFPSFKTLKASMYVKKFLNIIENETKNEKKKYDVVIDTCSNGLFNKKLKAKTLCYVHFPNFTKPKKGIKSVLNSQIIKKKDMYKYDKIICNSKFTQKAVQKITKKKTMIINPPVKTEKIKSTTKKKVITTIGRYSPEKKLEIIVKAFNQLSKSEKNYELIIIGAYNEKEDKEYLDKLKSLAKENKTNKITFLKNLPHKETLNKLEESEIYWHSRGYGEIDPVEYENFGITTVEAMAAGCTCFVINLGAQPELVQNGKTGYLWNTPKELVEKTKKYLKNKNKMIGKQALEASKKYSTKKFIQEIKKLI